MMRRKSPPSENIYFIENHCQIYISKGRGEKDKIVICIICYLWNYRYTNFKK